MQNFLIRFGGGFDRVGTGSKALHEYQNRFAALLSGLKSDRQG